MKLNSIAKAAALVAAASTVGMAQAAPTGDEAIYRVQVEIAVADIEDAGTDNRLYLRFNGGERYMLNTAKVGLGRGKTVMYDASPSNIRAIRDLTSFTVANNANDGLAMRRVRLIVNGATLFTKDYGSDHPYWIDGNNDRPRSVTFSLAEMRASSQWQAFRQPAPPLVIPASELETRIESIVGAKVWGTGVNWGELHGRPVEVSRNKKDPSKIHVDLDLEAKVTGPNPEVDVDFDLKVSCANGRLKADVSSMTAETDYQWWQKVASLGVLQLVENRIDTEIGAQMAALFPPLNIAQGLAQCPDITVQSDGSLLFSLPNSTVPMQRAKQAEATAPGAAQNGARTKRLEGTGSTAMRVK